MRQLSDPEHEELKRVLEAMLADNVDITAREVARRHPLRHASAFTRNVDRAKLISDAVLQQQLLRGIEKIKAPSLPPGEELRQAQQHIRKLELDVRRLVSAHQLCVRAVAACGGMSALERYWDLYQDIRETLDKYDAVPRARVLPLEPP